MPREIKFRGKRVDNGEWVYGYYCFNPFFKRAEIFSFDNIMSYVYEVIPESVGQYTGRTAQCTDMIYEGDRCVVTRFDHNGADFQYECVVEWMDGGFAFVNTDRSIFIPLWDVEDTDSDVEIIGSVHDNPSLLEVQP